MANNHFTVLVPSYNVEKWAHKNVLSVLNQNYDNFDLYYIDDCSTDNTVRVVEEVIKNNNLNITFEKNSFKLLLHCLSEFRLSHFNMSRSNMSDFNLSS